MFDVLIIFLIFYLLQLMLPMLLSIKSVPFSDFAGARDKSIDLSLYSQRADRAVRNFRESLPVVLMLIALSIACLLYTSPSPRDYAASRMPSSA